MKRSRPIKVVIGCSLLAPMLSFCAYLLLEFGFRSWQASYGGNAPLDHLLGQGKLGPFRGGAGFTYYEPGNTDPFFSGGYHYWSGDPGSIFVQHQSLSLSPKEGHRFSVTFGIGTRDFTILVPVGP